MFIVDVSKEKYLLLCYAAFVNAEYKSTFVSDVHEVVESCVVFMHVLSMNAEIISDSNDNRALVQDVVNLFLEYVLIAGQCWGGGIENSTVLMASWM